MALGLHAHHSAHATHSAHTTHSAHATHAAAAVVMTTGFSFRGLRLLGDDAVGGKQETSNARSILQRATIDLGWSDDAVLHQVAVLTGEGVEAFIALHFLDLGNNDGSLFACVVSNGAERHFECFSNQIDAGLLITLKLRAQLLE